ncbi:MAG: chromosome partitioning protein [Acidobacteria bacterium]|nr:MAG: chromosome partitioning protein [Acidobacteriota bacterium]PIE89143.1 MAG: chromosome partitioning protein [Acidobacteriota bacterium]
MALKGNGHKARGGIVNLKLVVASQKGGVGKTTVSMNLSVAFAELGLRTLLVDTDPQGAITLSLAKGSMEYPGLMELLSGRIKIKDALLKTNLNGLTLLPKGRLAMKNVPVYEKKLFQNQVLTKLFAAVDSHFDIIVIDTPAGLGMITRAAMKAGSHVLVPFKVDMLNLRSVNQILQVLDYVQTNENKELQFLGLLLTMFERETDTSYKVAGEVWKDFPLVLDTTIPRADIFHKASELGVPLSFMGSAKHPEARRFRALAEEILNLIKPEEDSEEQVVRRLL